MALPTQYEAIVHTAINRQPVEIQPPWFEFLEYGPGPYQKNEWCQYGLDMGEHATYVAPPQYGAQARIASTSGSDTGVVTVYGLDANKVAQSVTFTLPDATSSVLWSRIDRVTKPETVGDLVLSFIDRNGRQYVAADYRARDKNPTFRLYRFTDLVEDASKTIDAIVRRRLFDVEQDSDELFVTNLSALRLEIGRAHV